MSDLSKIIGKRIKSLRKDKGFSQEELAHLANINRSFMGEIERGEKSPTLGSLEKITNALEISFEELFRYIQPCQSNKDKTKNLSVIIEKLYSLNEADQKIILDIIDNILLISKKNKAR
ncbi:helix-turn-helix transcriptional regulator [Wukongibacter baidiensis]|uniref:helix-turn-helix domain-containing protein n=1 Tax=Wukongibacter baidiensis TaxID=1723361 RepID=UPI003D7F3664